MLQNISTAKNNSSVSLTIRWPTKRSRQRLP